MTLLLSKPEIEGLLIMEEMIGELETGFMALARGDVQQPPRLRIATRENGYGAFMPCYIPGTGMAVKINTNFPGNPQRGLARILGLLVLLDTETGAPLAILDSTAITAYRTAAASGVAIRHLASRDAATLAILGSGTLSLPHIQAAAGVRSIRRVRVYSPNLSTRHSEYLASARHFVDVPVEIASSAREAVEGAEILVVCTGSSEPVLDGSWIQPGACVVAVGNATSNSRELDTLTVKRARVVCDSVASCLTEAGDLLIPIREGSISRDSVLHELGQILLEGSTATGQGDIVLFKSVGLGFQDLIAARYVYRKAMMAGAGQRFDFIRGPVETLVH